MANERILIVDDEAELAAVVRDFLVKEGYKVDILTEGERFPEFFRSLQPNLVLLDLMMPKANGMELVRMLRMESDIPVIILSARAGDVDKILSLGFGADDYLTKPFSMGELTARVKAHLRRSAGQTKVSPSANPNILICGDLELDVKAYTAKQAERPLSLSAKEFELLAYLIRNTRQVFTREQLYEQIWDTNGFGDLNTVSVHIRKLREKIEPDPGDPTYIKTVWGVGYKLETP